jgi:hypothetical protein
MARVTEHEQDQEQKQEQEQEQAEHETRAVRWRLFGIAGLALLIAAGVIAWILRASVVNDWLAVHTGTDNVSGSYYGFWSGFGSDIAELGILGAIATGIYQLVKKWNCHEPGCWRIGTHPAAGGQFLLCYRHHPDYAGKKPTHDLIERLHREHTAREVVIAHKVDEIHERITARATDGESIDMHPNKRAPAE